MGEGFAMLASNQAQLFFYQDEAGQGGRRGGAQTDRGWQRAGSEVLWEHSQMSLS